MKLASPKMAAASVGADRVVSDLRVSRNAWLQDGEHPVVDRISRWGLVMQGAIKRGQQNGTAAFFIPTHRRINAITGYQTTLKYDRFKEGKAEEYEALQVRISSAAAH